MEGRYDVANHEMEGPKAIATLTHRFYIVERDQWEMWP